MHSAGDMQFNLPRVNLLSQVEINNRQANPQFNLETLLIEPNQLQLSMVWRAALSCDKQMLKIKNVNISLSR